MAARALLFSLQYDSQHTRPIETATKKGTKTA